VDFEDRMNRIAERHEALAQAVELLAYRQQKNEEILEKNQLLMAHVLESVDSLARIAQMHERRISDLEGSDPN
jgi:hypothetical protein